MKLKDSRDHTLLLLHLPFRLAAWVKQYMNAQQPAREMDKKEVQICRAAPFPQELHPNPELSNV